MSTNNPILNGMASVLWGSAWANHAEEHGCANLSGQKIEEVMPEIPAEAYLLASKFIGMLEQANGMDIHALMAMAATRDGIKTVTDDLREEFGSDLAFMVTGAGVSWFDDHEEFPLEVPYSEEYELQMLADDTCEDKGRPQSKCGHYCDPKDKKCKECGEAVTFDEDED